MKHKTARRLSFLMCLGLLLGVAILVPNMVNAQELETGSGSLLDNYRSGYQNMSIDVNAPPLDQELFAVNRNINHNLNVNHNWNLNDNINSDNNNSGRKEATVILSASPQIVEVGQVVTFTASVRINHDLPNDPIPVNILTNPVLPPGANYYNTWDYGDGNIEYFGSDLTKTHVYIAPGEYTASFDYSTFENYGYDEITITVLPKGGAGGGGMLPQELTAYSGDKQGESPEFQDMHAAAGGSVAVQITNKDGIDKDSITVTVDGVTVTPTLTETPDGYMASFEIPEGLTEEELLIVVGAKTSKGVYGEARLIVTNPHPGTGTAVISPPVVLKPILIEKTKPIAYVDDTPVMEVKAVAEPMKETPMVVLKKSVSKTVVTPRNKLTVKKVSKTVVKGKLILSKKMITVPKVTIDVYAIYKNLVNLVSRFSLYSVKRIV